MSSAADDRLMTEAEHWVNRLGDPACPVEDRQVFERWRMTPAHAAAFERAQWLWRAMGELAGREDLERFCAEALASTGPAAKAAHARKLSWALAASVAVAAFGVSAFYFGRHYTPTQVYVTEAGQRTTVQLEDGSQVTLNVGTRLEVKLAPGRRQFQLRNGEAVFTVAEDPHRPFVVSAGGGEVTALGTRFQVRNETKRVTVTLLEGRIAVAREATGEQLQLQPGDQVRFGSDTTRMSRWLVDPAVVSSWTSGLLKFKATPLAEVLDEMNRYSRTPLRLREPALAGTPIHATVELGDTPTLVSALESMLPVEAVRNGGAIVLVRRNKK